MSKVTVCVLGSGSRGNCVLVKNAAGAVLVDAGFSATETARRLAAAGSGPEEIASVLLGHEHLDHSRGLDVIARKWKVPVFLNRAAAGAVKSSGRPEWDLRIFQNGYPFETGGFLVTAFSVIHDARDPVGFTLETPSAKIFVATDLGRATSLVRERLRGAQIAVLESNHDRSLLLNGNRPWIIKNRIKSGLGHLSNEETARLLARPEAADLEDVFLAHISLDSNRPQLVLESVGGVLKKRPDGGPRLHLTFQDRISAVVSAGEVKKAKEPPPGQLALPGAGWV